MYKILTDLDGREVWLNPSSVTRIRHPLPHEISSSQISIGAAIDILGGKQYVQESPDLAASILEGTKEVVS